MFLGCLDHFLENEVYDNSWDSLYSILTDPELHDIMIDVGCVYMELSNLYMPKDPSNICSTVSQSSTVTADTMPVQLS